MTKNVEYKGKAYKISSTDYGFSSQRLVVNGEVSSKIIDNGNLQDVRSFPEYARKAIVEYEQRNQANKAFKEWDGKLD